MHYTFHLAQQTAAVPLTAALARSVRTRAEADARWPTVASALRDLRDQRRRSVAILDPHCGCGALLIHAARYARTLGFVSVEARGIDPDPRHVAAARTSARGLVDTAVELRFYTGTADTGWDDLPPDVVVPSLGAAWPPSHRVIALHAERHLTPRRAA